MKAPHFSALLASAILAGAAIAQDAPPAGAEPALTLDAPTTDDAAKKKVKLLDDATGSAVGDLPVGKTVVQPETEGGDAPSSALPDSVKNMTDEDRRKLGGLLEDAATYLGGIRVQEAFEKIVAAEAMVDDYAPVYNLKGAAYTKLRDFEKAEVAFKRAVELDPRAFMSRFNLTEIFFVSGKFAVANAAFKKMLADNPKMPEGTRALIRFKMLVSHLKQGNVEEAKAILETFNFFDDHPGFYFGNAAIHYQADEEEEAIKWVTSATKIYQKAQIDIYTDSFIEVGWIENLQ